MIWSTYLAILLISIGILWRIKNIYKRFLLSILISVVTTVTVCSFFLETIVIQEEIVFLPARYTKSRGSLVTEKGDYHSIDNSRVVLDTITGVRVVKIKRESPKVIGLFGPINCRTNEVIEFHLDKRLRD